MGETPIQSKGQFKNTPQGLQQRWTIEIGAAKQNQRDWLKDAESCNNRYLDEKRDSASTSRLNLFHANVNIEMAILYGQVPKVDVSRRFDDAQDDAARVGGECLERILNTDIEQDDDGFRSALRYSLLDWKISGLGVVRLRYETGEEVVKQEAVPAKTRPQVGPDGAPVLDPETQEPVQEHLADEVPEVTGFPDEQIATDYVYWRDFLWSPCRTWHDARWIAFRTEMTRDQAVERFGVRIGKTIPLESRKLREGETHDDLKDTWSRASVWEIWSKEDKTVYWFVEGYDRILDTKKDPLGLRGFWPCPKPLFANTTTTKLIPRPAFLLAKDLYDEIDRITARLGRLEEMARVTGAYNKAFPELQRILQEAGEGKLIGVEGWTALSEKGGINKQIDTLNEFLAVVAKLIEVLSTKRTEKIALLYQINGISDIVRGQATGQATATEQRIKAGFASTRLQTEQDEVARFASDHQKIRAEIIAKHFDGQTIVERSNLMNTPDAQLAPQAVELIKSNTWQYRIEVKPDSIALRDYASLKQERVETIGALTQVFQAGIPMMQMMPQAGPFLLEVGKWLLAATKGSQQIEGVFDRFAAMAEQQAQQPKPPAPPDPKLQAAQVKSQAEQFKAKADVASTMLDAKVKVAQHQMDMEKMRAEAARDQQRTQAEMAAAIIKPPTQAGA